MKKFFTLLCMLTILLSSCSKSFYQVYTTKSSELKESEQNLFYENKDCKITYCLWAEGGNPGFIMENKTDRNLFVVLPQSFLIKNGMAFDYFQNREFTSATMESYSTTSSYTKALSASAGLSKMYYGYDTKLWSEKATVGASATINSKTTRGSNYGQSVSVKEKPILCIPPHSAKVIAEFGLFNQHIRDCDKKQEYPKRKSTPIEYSKENSPLVFKNRIAYSFDSEGENISYVENEFWISEVTNYSHKEAMETIIQKECENDPIVERVRFKISSPKMFYNTYLKKQ